MTRDELAAIALRYETLIADAMLRALGMTRACDHRVRIRDWGAKERRYSGARKLMKQRHGVRGI